MRIKNAFRNSFFSIISQIILIIVGFFSQRVMNLRLGEELVGMNSVISNIIALLSVTELGISVAVVYHLYRAIATNDEEQIAGLMNLYRKAYYVFAVVIGGLGLLIMPFVHLFLKENTFSLDYVRLIYFLWLVRTIASYLLSYKRSVLIADQKEYIVSIGTLFANVLNYSMIIVIVELTQNYALALTLNIVVEFVINIWISCYVDMKYAFLKRYRRVPLDGELVHKVLQDIKNIFVTRLSNKLLLSTDSLIMSSFISVVIVGLYSNYAMITQSVANVIISFSNALQPTIGNMLIEEDHEKEYGVLRQITFIFFWIASFSAVSLLVLMTPFVTDIWLGSSYVLNIEIILWCVLNFFTQTVSMPLGTILSVTGLFQKEKKVSILATVTNLVLSLILVQYLGVVGVLVGTFGAYIVQIIYRIRILVHEYMKLESKRYIIELVQYISITIAECSIVYVISQSIYQSGNRFSFLMLMLCCVLVPNGINFLLYRKSWRFQSVFGMVRSMLQRT
ncbi:MAG: oligosaccharide flippase family protein [Lachnospiraceae bacterium]|nr:oligosaccharide flippase family protein [Lachnospiraceae bacterium]